MYMRIPLFCSYFKRLNILFPYNLTHYFLFFKIMAGIRAGTSLSGMNFVLHKRIKGKLKSCPYDHWDSRCGELISTPLPSNPSSCLSPPSSVSLFFTSPGLQVFNLFTHPVVLRQLFGLFSPGIKVS